MPGPLTHVAIALQARDRLGQVRDALRAKKNAGTASAMELQVLYLADRAHAMMDAAQPVIDPPLRLYGPPLTAGVSRFALLGAVGPDLTRYSAMFARGQGWLFDTMHKGGPDEHRERVLARSTDFVFTFWRRVQPLLDQEFPTDAERKAARDKVRAYLLGHLCHVAADVVSHPWFDEVGSHLGEPGRPRLGRDAVAGAVEREVAEKFFRRGTRTRGEEWSTWWPAVGDVPGSFFTAYAETLRELHGAEGRPPGFRAFEEEFAAIDPPPPALSPRLVRDGVSTFRMVAETGTAWDLWDWLGVTAPTFLSAFAAYPLAAVLTRAGDFETPLKGSQAEIDEQERVRTYELVAFPFAATALTPLVTMIWVSASAPGVGREIVTGWVAAGLRLAAAVGFFATLGGAGEARWALFFVVPLFVEVAHMLHVLIHGGRDDRHWQLALGTILHLLLALVFLLCYRAFLHPGIAELKKPEEERDAGVFVGWMALWFGIVFVLWIGHALLWRYLAGARAADDAEQAFVRQPHYLRLVDDAVLYRDPQGPSPDLAALYYPAGRRPLLRLWWTGAEAPRLTVRFDRDRLVFRFAGAAAAADQTVFAPVAPTTLREFADLLRRTVRDSAGNATAKLQAELFHAEDLDYELPPGIVFSDHGDDQDARDAHDAEAARFENVGTSRDGATVLHHAPRDRLSARFGRRGPVPEETRPASQPSVAGSTITAAADPRRITASAGAFLTRIFRPGDLLETTAAPVQARVVVKVVDDTTLEVSTPFSPPLPAAGVGYHRAADDRTTDRAGPGTVSSGPGLRDATGTAAAAFGSLFRPGDTIRVTVGGKSQERRVAAVVNDQLLTLERPLTPPVPAAPAAAYVRVADEAAEGFRYLADADDTLFSGETLMNSAANLATLLCLGGASRLLPDEERTGAAVDTPSQGLNRVYQVFRNWNLDRRRENEWRMLVLGDAVSEKRGNPGAADPAAPVEPGWTLLAGAGEPVASRLGWETVFLRWLDVARRPGTSITAATSLRPGDPTNLELSRALAFLLDMRDPAPPGP